MPRSIIITFSDLPLELSEHIVLLAAHLYTLDDKSTVANLSRVSRAIHRLVQPILPDTIVLTALNISRVYAMPAHSTAFAATQCLIMEGKLDPHEWEDGLRALLRTTSAFRHVDRFCGPLWALYALLDVGCKPVRVVFTPNVRIDITMHLAETRIQNLLQVTHIRGDHTSTIPMWISGRQSHGLQALGGVTHVTLELGRMGQPGGLHFQMAVRIAPNILDLPNLRRLCLCVPNAVPDADRRRADLARFAYEHRETRLWIRTDEQPTYDRRTVFSDEHWESGYQLYARTSSATVTK